MAPRNPYDAAGRRLLSDSKGLGDSFLVPSPSLASTMQGIRSTVDMSKYFDEFVDDSLLHKVGPTPISLEIRGLL